MTPLHQFRTACSFEWLKFRHARVAITSTLLLIVGIALIVLASLYASGGNTAFASKAAAMMPDTGWAGLFAVATQVTAVAGLLAFGVTTGWMFGREFTDGTIVGLYALPTSRAAIALAKFTVLLIWAIAVAITLTLAILLLGLLLNFEAPAIDIVQRAARLMLVCILTALLAVPCALAATIGRGYLTAIGAILAIVVLAQIAVMVGFGGWFTFAAPGVWGARTTAIPDPITLAQLALVVPLAAFSIYLTTRSWRRITL